MRYGIQDMKLNTHRDECVELYLCCPISFTVCRETTLSGQTSTDDEATVVARAVAYELSNCIHVSVINL
jgi:hypothetical protein